MCYDTCACVCSRCVRVCVFCVLEPHISAFFFNCFALLAAAAAAAAAAVSCLFRTVPQALKLSTWWQPRYNRSRTAILCGPLLCVCCVFYDTCACVYDLRCVQVCAFVCWKPTFQLFFCLLCLLLLLPYHVVCITPCLKLPSSLLCGSHCTTAVSKFV